MFFIAEIGSNWEGNVRKAQKLMYFCKEAGANAVKFQMWRANDLYDGKYKKFELTFDKAREIKKLADEIGIEFFCSVFYPEAVEFLEKLGVKKYKLASRTVAMKDPYSSETIRAVIYTEKPIIFSNGFNIKTEFADYFTELYCIPEYPADPKEISWERIKRFDGFSDHTLGINSSLMYAKTYPNKIIEKHVKLEDSISPDACFSITTQELAQLITLSTS